MNGPHLPDGQGQHVAHVVARALERGVRSVEVSEAAEAAWVDVLRLSGRGREFLESSTPGGDDDGGRLSGGAAQNGFFGEGPVEFFRLLREWRERGDLAGLERSAPGADARRR